MDNYTIKRLSTIAACDILLKKVTDNINTLKERQYRQQKRISVHNRVVNKSSEELLARQAELQVLRAGLSAAAGERKAKEYRCKITKAEWRIQMMELRLEDYDMPKLVLKELYLQQIETALADAELLLQLVSARRGELVRKAVQEQLSVSPSPLPAGQSENPAVGQLSSWPVAAQIYTATKPIVRSVPSGGYA